MSLLKRIGVLAIAATLAVVGFEIGGPFSSRGGQSLIPTAEARIGRPLTPVSVAGVARRTVRRCAVGVYNC